MSVSRFRHTQPSVSKADKQFLNVSSSQALWAGSNMIACSEDFVAVPWAHMGSTAIFTHQGYGKVGPNPPVLTGHEGAVIDVQFNPFEKHQLFTAGEDGQIMGWRIPVGGLKENCSEPIVRINGHDKKCGNISFHPSASNVLASAALDRTVKIWDVEREASKTVMSDFEDYPMDLSWNLDGSEICVVTRDKKLSVFDVRDGSVAATGACHDSARALRCVWAKRKDQIITFGWDGTQRRQMKVWDPRKLSRPISSVIIDQGSAAMMPMYDEDLSLLYVACKGEGCIRAYELMEGSLVPSHEQTSSESVKGVCLVPKQCLNVKQCEIGRICELGQHNMLTIHMNLPRKQSESEFQKDVYPPTFADKAAITAEEFFTNNKTSVPCECDLECLFEGKKPVIKKHHTEQHGKPGASSAVKALKKPVRRETGEKPAHADPSANMVHDTPEEKVDRLQELVQQLEKQRAAVCELRRQVEQKEAEMTETVKQIQSIYKS